MLSKFAASVLVAVLLVSAVMGIQQWTVVRRAHAAARAMAQATRWFPAAQNAAELMIERYGPPQEISAFEMRWHGPSPWKRIVVQNEPQAPLEDVVTYDFPASKLADLNRFPHGVRVYPLEGALAARSDSEAVNLLSLNLAGNIAAGETTPEDANRFFVRTLRLREAGKSSPYMERLLFRTRTESYPAYPMP
jgi:hypothetical protein